MAEAKVRRKRGAQPGNSNALKHGFYSRKYLEQEIDDLEVHVAEGVKDEIVMMRVFTRRLVDLGNVKDLADAISVLGALGMASIHLASLLKSQRILAGKDDELSEALNEALTEIMKEIRPGRL